MRVLKNYRNIFAKLCALITTDVDPVYRYLTRFYIVEAVEKVGYRCFSRTRRTYECYLLSCVGIKRNIFKNRLFRLVSEGNVI